MAITRLGLHGGPRREYALGVVASAAVSGTAVSGLTETQVRDVGGDTVILTYTNDTLVAAGAAFDAERAGIRDGLVSDGSDPNGLNALISTIPVTAVIRTSDTVVTITLPALPTYDIAADRIWTHTTPASALVTSSDPIVGSPTIAVTADAQPSTAKGRSKVRKRYLIEIDGELFDADNIMAVEAALANVRELAEISAKRDVKTAIPPKPPRITVKTRSGPTTSKIIKREVKRTQQVINRLYTDAAKQIARDQEIGRLIVSKLDEEDEQDSIMALLM